MVARLRFSRWHVTDRLEEAAVVEPVHPFEGGVLDRLQGSPRATAADDLGLEQADDGLGEGVDAPIWVKSWIARLEPAQVAGRGSRRSRARRSA